MFLSNTLILIQQQFCFGKINLLLVNGVCLALFSVYISRGMCQIEYLQKYLLYQSIQLKNAVYKVIRSWSSWFFWIFVYEWCIRKNIWYVSQILQMQKWYANANVRDKLQRFIHIFAKPAEKQIYSNKSCWCPKSASCLLLFRMHWRDKGNFLEVSENLLPPHKIASNLKRISKHLSLAHADAYEYNLNVFVVEIGNCT